MINELWISYKVQLLVGLQNQNGKLEINIPIKITNWYLWLHPTQRYIGFNVDNAQVTVSTQFSSCFSS
jgi:hypothetical protein